MTYQEHPENHTVGVTLSQAGGSGSGASTAPHLHHQPPDIYHTLLCTVEKRTGFLIRFG